jgi:hypothetical protein
LVSGIKVDANARGGSPVVIAIIIGLLAAFSLISFALGTDDGRQPAYSPRDEVTFWRLFGSH